MWQRLQMFLHACIFFDAFFLHVSTSQGSVRKSPLISNKCCYRFYLNNWTYNVCSLGPLILRGLLVFSCVLQEAVYYVGHRILCSNADCSQCSFCFFVLLSCLIRECSFCANSVGYQLICNKFVCFFGLFTKRTIIMEVLT